MIIPEPLSPLQQAFEEFLLMRKKIKKPATEYAVKLLKSKLNKMSAGNVDLAIDILNQSIINCWQDVYELKEDKNKKAEQVTQPYSPGGINQR